MNTNYLGLSKKIKIANSNNLLFLALLIVVLVIPWMPSPSLNSVVLWWGKISDLVSNAGTSSSVLSLTQWGYAAGWMIFTASIAALFANNLKNLRELLGLRRLPTVAFALFILVNAVFGLLSGTYWLLK